MDAARAQRVHKQTQVEKMKAELAATPMYDDGGGEGEEEDEEDEEGEDEEGEEMDVEEVRKRLMGFDPSDLEQMLKEMELPQPSL